MMEANNQEPNSDGSSQTPTQKGPIEASHVENSNPPSNPDLLIPHSGSQSHLLLIISAVLAAIALLLMAGFFVLNWYIRSQEIKPSGIVVIPTVTMSATKSTPTPDPTADWKTYTNTTYGYSLKYPKDFKIDESDTPPNSYLHIGKEHAVTLIGGMDPSEDKFYSFIISTVENPNKLTLNDYINTFQDTSQIPSVSTSINGIPAIRITLGGSCSGDDHVFAENQDYIYNIEWSGCRGNKSDPKIFDQILSTFKFTDSATTPTCTPRPACLDATPRCMIPELSTYCPPK